MLATIAVTAAACGATTAPTVVATPSPTAAASLSPSPVATGSPQASLQPGTAALDAFLALVAGHKLSFHAALKGALRATISDGTISGSVDVAGDDADTVTTQAYAFGTFRVEQRTVGGTTWERIGTGPWTKRGTATGEMLAPFSGVTMDAVHAVKLDTVAGRQVVTVKLDGTHFFDTATVPAPNLTSEATRSTTFDLVLDLDGRPVSGHFVYHGTGRVSSQLQAIDVELEMTFSKVGSAIRIVAP